MVVTSEEIKSKDFALLKLYQNKVTELLGQDKYISKKEYLKIYKEYVIIILLVILILYILKKVLKKE